jgi:hypothetical protein
MFSGRFIGSFSEFSDEFLEDEAHFFVGNLVGVKINRGEFLDDHEKKVLAVQAGDLFCKVKSFKNVPGVFGKVSEIGFKILPNVLGVIQKSGKCETGDGIEFLAGDFQEKRGKVLDPGVFSALIFFENLVFCGFENAIQSAKNSKGQDDLSVVGLFVVPSEKISNGPKKGRLFRKV